MQYADGSEIVCPQCGSDDIVEDMVTLRVKMPLGMSKEMCMLGTGHTDHKNFPIMRCQSCNNVALSQSALAEVIPEISGKKVEMVPFPENFHELN